MGRLVSAPRATAGLASSAEGGVSTTKRPCMDSTPRDSQLSTQAASSDGVMPSASHTVCSEAFRPCDSSASKTRSSAAEASFRYL